MVYDSAIQSLQKAFPGKTQDQLAPAALSIAIKTSHLLAEKENALQGIIDLSMKKFLQARSVIKETLDSQPDTSDPVQHNKWLTQGMQELERIMQ